MYINQSYSSISNNPIITLLTSFCLFVPNPGSIVPKLKTQIHCESGLSLFFSLSCISHFHVLLSNLSSGFISLFSSVCIECVATSLWALQGLLMWGFIYLTDLLLEEKDYGDSCCGAEGTAVPQCSVPHYRFLMRRNEGFQGVSPSGLALLDDQCCS